MKLVHSRTSIIALVIGAMALLGGLWLTADIAHSATITPIAGQNYYLYAGGISTTATSITLTSATYPATTTKITTADLGTTAYITIEPGNTTRQEIAACTTITQNADNTATLSNCTRGLRPYYPYTADSTLRKQHPGGSIVTFSNPPQLYNDIITYINQAAFNGAPDASTIVKGISELATQAETALGTQTGSSGPLVIQNQYATSTYNSATAANRVVVTGVGGKIDNNFIATSTLLAATSTINIGSFPAWQIGKQHTEITTLGTSTFAVPSGVTKLIVDVQGAGAAGGGSNGFGGSSGGHSTEVVDVTGTSTIQVYVGSAGTGVSSNPGGSGQWTTFGTNGFYLYATGGVGGQNNATGVGSAPGQGFGGDINLGGGRGDSGANIASNQRGGNGGGCFYGGPGGGAYASSGGQAGGDATAYGCGGGGGAGTSVAGGAGMQGFISIRW